MYIIADKKSNVIHIGQGKLITDLTHGVVFFPGISTTPKGIFAKSHLLCLWTSCTTADRPDLRIPFPGTIGFLQRILGLLKFARNFSRNRLLRKGRVPFFAMTLILATHPWKGVSPQKSSQFTEFNSENFIQKLKNSLLHSSENRRLARERTLGVMGHPLGIGSTNHAIIPFGNLDSTEATSERFVVLLKSNRALEVRSTGQPQRLPVRRQCGLWSSFLVTDETLFLATTTRENFLVGQESLEPSLFQRAGCNDEVKE